MFIFFLTGVDQKQAVFPLENAYYFTLLKKIIFKFLKICTKMNLVYQAKMASYC